MKDQKYVGQLMGESRATIALALPLMIGNITFMLVAWIDTLMIGRLGVTELAATTFANNILHLPFMFGIGVGIAVSIRVSQARGASDPPAARAAFGWSGLFLFVVEG